MAFAIGEEEFEREIPYVCEDCVQSLSIESVVSGLYLATPTWRTR
jgi:hypothetical protein